MKKRICLLLALVLIVGSFAGCKEAPEDVQVPTQEETRPREETQPQEETGYPEVSWSDVTFILERDVFLEDFSDLYPQGYEALLPLSFDDLLTDTYFDPETVSWDYLEHDEHSTAVCFSGVCEKPGQEQVDMQILFVWTAGAKMPLIAEFTWTDFSGKTTTWSVDAIRQSEGISYEESLLRCDVLCSQTLALYLVEVPQAGTEPAETVRETEPAAEALPYLQEIPQADQSIYAGPGYDYGYVRTVELAGIYTIVEEAWDAEGNLWGKLKSGAGWVDLTQIRQSEARPEPITANYADAALLAGGNYHHFVEDTSEYAVAVAFRANEPLYNVTFHEQVWAEVDMVAGPCLYRLDRLDPEKPLVVDVDFPGDISAYEIQFTDANGVSYRYSISISGRNGSLALCRE